MPVPVGLGPNIGAYPVQQNFRPVSESFGQALGFAQGLGKLRDEEIARQQAAELRQVWDTKVKQYAGNPEKLWEDPELMQVLGPDNLLKIREQQESAKLRSDIAKIYAEARIKSSVVAGESREKVAGIHELGRTDVAGILSESKKYGYDSTAAVRKYIADSASAASMYGADKGFLGKKYVADIIAEAKRYGIDVGADIDKMGMELKEDLAREDRILKREKLRTETETRKQLADQMADLRKELQKTDIDADERAAMERQIFELEKQRRSLKSTEKVAGMRIEASSQDLSTRIAATRSNLERKLQFEGDKDTLDRAARQSNLLLQLEAAASRDFLNREQREELFQLGLEGEYQKIEKRFANAVTLAEKREAYLDAAFLRDAGLKTSILELKRQYIKERDILKHEMEDGSEPTKRYRRVDGGEFVEEEWNEDTHSYEEISRGPRSTTAFIGADAMNDPQIVAAAEAIYNGQVPPDFYTKRSHFRAAVTQYLTQNHPDFDLTKLLGESKAATNVVLNRSMAILESITEPQAGHPSLIDELVRRHKELGFTKFRMVNKAIRVYLTQTGDPRITAYDNLRGNLAQELGNALGMAAITDSRLKMEREMLAENPSYEQILSAAEVTKDIIKARLVAIRTAQGRGKEFMEGEQPTPDQSTGRYRIISEEPVQQ